MPSLTKTITMASMHHIQQKFPFGMENEHTYQSFYRRTKLCRFLIGVVIQLSTMGADYLILSYITSSSADVDITVDKSVQATSEQYIISFGFCCWSTLTSVFAFMMLGCLNHYLSIKHHRLQNYASDNRISKRCADEIRHSADTDTSEAYSS
jgi:hypothetical protein